MKIHFVSVASPMLLGLILCLGMPSTTMAQATLDDVHTPRATTGATTGASTIAAALDAPSAQDHAQKLSDAIATEKDPVGGMHGHTDNSNPAAMDTSSSIPIVADVRSLQRSDGRNRRNRPIDTVPRVRNPPTGIRDFDELGNCLTVSGIGDNIDGIYQENFIDLNIRGIGYLRLDNQVAIDAFDIPGGSVGIIATDLNDFNVIGGCISRTGDFQGCNRNWTVADTPFSSEIDSLELFQFQLLVGPVARSAKFAINRSQCRFPDITDDILNRRPQRIRTPSDRVITGSGNCLTVSGIDDNINGIYQEDSIRRSNFPRIVYIRSDGQVGIVAFDITGGSVQITAFDILNDGDLIGSCISRTGDFQGCSSNWTVADPPVPVGIVDFGELPVGPVARSARFVINRSQCRFPNVIDDILNRSPQRIRGSGGSRTRAKRGSGN